MATLPRNKVPITVSIPIDFLCEFDEYLQKINKNRTEFVLDAIKEKMQRDTSK